MQDTFAQVVGVSSICLQQNISFCVNQYHLYFRQSSDHRLNLKQIETHSRQSSCSKKDVMQFPQTSIHNALQGRPCIQMPIMLLLTDLDNVLVDVSFGCDHHFHVLLS